jgi:PPOX class probable F420-dependent enzyme
MFSGNQFAFILAQRVAHLATADSPGRPHVMPVVFAYHGGAFWIAVDEKPKRTVRLKRLRNIEENPHVSLLFDRYDDDWLRLGYVLVQGMAAVLERGDQQPGALAALRERYPQYREMRLEERPLITVTPEKVSAWGDLSG